MQNDGSFLQKFFDSLSHEIPDLQFFYAVTKHVTLDSSWNTKNFPSYGRMTDFTRIYLPLKGEGFGELPSGKTALMRHLFRHGKQLCRRADPIGWVAAYNFAYILLTFRVSKS